MNVVQRIYRKRGLRYASRSTQLRFVPLSREEFTSEIYRPGVISLSRLVWGSVGGGLLLTIIGVLSEMTGIAVLFPPLAATCFIVTTCPYLRVARPKPVIVGHFIASLCGLAGVAVGESLVGGSEYAIAVKLGFSVLFATVSMQLLDADHPPAAATSAIPAILPLPMPEYMLPFCMAWGATIAVLFSFLWNRVWFEFPAKDKDNRENHYGLYMEPSQIVAVFFCLVGFIVMCFQQVGPVVHSIGIMVMLTGVSILGSNHYFGMKRNI